VAVRPPEGERRRPPVRVGSLDWEPVRERLLERPLSAAAPQSPPPAPRAAQAEPEAAPRADVAPEPAPAFPPPAPPEEVPPPALPPAPAAPPAIERRRWNVFDLELRTRRAAGADPERDEERGLLLLYLREFGDISGDLPEHFDPLVRESFSDLL
jgi:hypothetical protein